MKAAAFWARVEKHPDGCWIWTGAQTVRFGSRQMLPHRAAWCWTYGLLPHRTVVTHTCGNPACVNPAHLHALPLAAFVSEMNRGERQGGAKLTEKDVQAIRAARAQDTPLRTLAERYGVAISTITMVTTGRTWRHSEEGHP